VGVAAAVRSAARIRDCSLAQERVQNVVGSLGSGHRKRSTLVLVWLYASEE